jgi:Fur family ferric uptake transcriptional regulator
LEKASIKPIANRVRVLEVIDANGGPMSADDIHKALEAELAINRVTVYRILDLLSDAGLVERLSTGGRAHLYGLSARECRRPHAHFYCTACGRLDCLDPMEDVFAKITTDLTAGGRVQKVEIRIDGVCRRCMDRCGH